MPFLSLLLPDGEMVAKREGESHEQQQAADFSTLNRLDLGLPGILLRWSHHECESEERIERRRDHSKGRELPEDCRDDENDGGDQEGVPELP